MQFASSVIHSSSYILCCRVNWDGLWKGVEKADDFKVQESNKSLINIKSENLIKNDKKLFEINCNESDLWVETWKRKWEENWSVLSENLSLRNEMKSKDQCWFDFIKENRKLHNSLYRERKIAFHCLCSQTNFSFSINEVCFMPLLSHGAI